MDSNKLLILDINDTLAERFIKRKNFSFVNSPYPHAESENLVLYLRPYLKEFLDFCFSHYKVAIWTSMKRKNTDICLDCIFTPEQRDQLFFVKSDSEKKDKREICSNYSSLLFIDNTLSKVNMNSVEDYYVIAAFDARVPGDNALLILTKILPSLL